MILRSRNLLICKGIYVLWLSLFCLPAYAQDADAILRKCTARYDSARTLQGTFLVTIRAFSCPDDNYDKIDFNLTNDKQGRVERYAERQWTKHSEAVRVDDDWYKRAEKEARTALPNAYTVERGKTGFRYYPNTKEYQSYPLTPRKFSQRLLEGCTLSAPTNFAGDKKTVVSEIIDEGKPAYKIRVERRDRKLNFTMVHEVIIDKRTYQLKKLTGASNFVMVSMVISNERLNAPIPAALFAWSPPKDYKVLPDHPAGPDP